MKYHGLTIFILSLLILISVVSVTFVHAGPAIVDGILAVVNQDIITLSDLIVREKGIYGTNESLQGLSIEAKKQLREKLLQDLIDERLMISEAIRLKLTPSETDVLESIEQLKIKNNIFSDEVLKTTLEKEGLTVDELKRKINEDISLFRIRQYLANSGMSVTDKEVLDYYENEWKGKKEGTRVKISHILLKCTECVDQEKERAILSKAEEIKQKWDQGTPFAELASQYSEDESAGSGGSLGVFYTENLKPEFVQAIRDLQPGKIAGPIKTDLGYHIILLEERKEYGLESDSPIWNKIKETIIEKKRADFYDTWIKRLRKNGTVVIHKETLDRDI